MTQTVKSVRIHYPNTSGGSVMLQTILTWCASAGIKLVIAAAITILGWIFTTKIANAIRNSKRLVKLDKTAANFISNACNVGMKTLILVIAISVVGIPMASVVAVLATAGAAIGLALQGGLSNIAGGILILIFKPFKLGDYITADGESGTVTDINIFYTTLKTVDNKTVLLPNGAVSGNKVVNLSSEPLRRVDFEFTVDYGTNTNGVMALLERIGKNNEMVLDDPEVSTMIGGYNEKGIVIYLRVWCKSADYWDVFFDVNKTVKEEFERYDVNFAHPQLDVHIQK